MMPRFLFVTSDFQLLFFFPSVSMFFFFFFHLDVVFLGFILKLLQFQLSASLCGLHLVDSDVAPL